MKLRSTWAVRQSRVEQAAVLDRSADAVRKAKIMALAMGLIGLGMALLGGFLAGP